MFTLLFDSGFWYDIMFIALAIGLIYLCFKYKSAKYYVGTFAIIVLLGVTAYCGIQLNAYYTSNGGIFGYISSVIKPNTGEITVTDKIEFKIDNIVMTQQTDGSYTAKILLGDTLELKEDKIYTVLVNGEPCSKNEYSTGSTSYIRAEYAYSFMDNDLQTLCADNLIFNISFFKKSTEVTLTSKGGQTAVDYWHTYFAKNDCKVSVVPSTYERDSEIEFGEGDFSNYSTLTYMVGDEVYLTQIFYNSQTITLAKAPNRPGFVFKYWTDENGHKVNDKSKFTTSKTLKAVYNEIVEETLFEGTKEIWLGDGQTLYTDYVTLNLASYFDIDFTNIDFDIEFDFSLHSQTGEASGSNVMTFKPGNKHAIQSSYGLWGEFNLSTNGVFTIALTDLFDVYSANFNIYKITHNIEVPENALDGTYTAKSSYYLGEMGFSEEYGFEINIDFEIIKNKLSNYTYTVNPTFDFEKEIGMSYEEYLTENGETKAFFVNASQEQNLITFEVQGLLRTGEKILLNFDYKTLTWSITNNLSCATTSSIAKIY